MGGGGGAGSTWRRLDELAWDTRVLRALINGMLAQQNWPNGQRATPADLLRAWGGARGLTRREFMERVRSSFFSADLVDGADELWEAEVQGVVGEAFGELMRTVAGENFLQRVGLVHLERWLAGQQPDGHGGVRFAPEGEGGGAYDVRALPLKSRRQLAKVEKVRRKRRDKAAAATVKRERIDWVARARPAIAAAAETLAAREEERLVCEAEWVLRRLRPSVAGGRPVVHVLQRWETDARGDLGRGAFGPQGVEATPAHARAASPPFSRTAAIGAPIAQPRTSPRTSSVAAQSAAPPVAGAEGTTPRRGRVAAPPPMGGLHLSPRGLVTPGAAAGPGKAAASGNAAAAAAAPTTTTNAVAAAAAIVPPPPASPPPPERPRHRQRGVRVANAEEEMQFQMACVEYIRRQKRSRVAMGRAP